MKPFTPSTAPRNGRVKGSKNRLSAQSMLILDKLLVDWTKHGAAVLRTLRIERPELYAKLALDVASRVTLAGSEIVDDRPMKLIVHWGIRDPSKPMPPPPETAHPSSSSPPASPLPTMTPASPAKLLTFHRLSD